MPGYRFAKWEGISSSDSQQIEINTTSDSYLTAIFEQAELINKNLIINEINYNSAISFDTEDWIELYNPIETDIGCGGNQ
jgi:hypothetical protein